MTEQIKHHDFSPSRLNQFALCPGAYLMQQGIPEEPKSPDADEGTMLHAAVAAHNLEGLNPEQTAAVQFCLDYLDKIVKEKGESIHAIYYEERLTVYDRDVYEEHIANPDDILTEGIADVVVVYSDKTADVIDWKFGRGEVPDVKENYQTAAYSLGVYQRFDCSEVTAHIVQPRLLKTERYTFRMFGMLQRAVFRVIDAAKNAADAGLLLRASENACKYCKAKALCPAFAAKFSGLAVVRTDGHVPISPDQLLDYWEKAQIVERFVAEIKARVTAYIEENGNLGDWYLMERSGKREIRDTAKLYERVSKLLTGAELAECYTVSVTAVIDKLAAGEVTRAAVKGEKLAMKTAREHAEELLGDIILRGKPTRTLARRKDGAK